MKHKTAQNPRAEELYLRAVVNGKLGYAAAVPQSWIDALPVDRLLPHFRKAVLAYERGSSARARRRAGAYAAGRDGESTSGGSDASLPDVED